MLQPQGGNSAVAGTGQQGERDQRAIAPLDLRTERHLRDHMRDLVERREGFVTPRSRDAHVVVGHVEVIRVGIAQTGLVPCLAGQPLKEPPEVRQRRVQRGLAQFRARDRAGPSGEVPLERDRLFKVKRPEVAEVRIDLEPRQGSRDGIHRGLALPLRLLQIGEVLPFDPLVFGVVREHGSMSPV